MKSIKMPPVATRAFPFVGGLDQVTPPIQLQNGMLRYASNVEIGTRGGYARCAGYERFSGQARPSDASYAILSLAMTGTVVVGDVISNAAATKTGKVIAIATDNSYVVITQVVGTFAAGETLKVGATTVGTASGPQMNGGASTPALNAAYTALAANVYRALIGPVPGSGPVLGVHLYNGHVYAFRNNAGGTAAVMHVDSPAGWTPVALGRELGFAQRSAVVTISIAAPGVVTWNAHGLAAGQRITFSTTGAVPTGLTTGVNYYVLAPTANTFNVAATPGGTAITTSGTQSGVHTAYLMVDEIDDGVTVTGKTSGAVAVAQRVVLTTGIWAGAPSGSFVFTSVTGAFVSGEGLSITGGAGNIVLNASTVDVPITLAPGGRYEFVNWNFYGQASTIRMYGASGTHRAFEFDGTVFAPFSIPGTDDKPVHIEVHKNALFLSIRSSVFNSAPGGPFNFQAQLGGSEFACGEDVNVMLSMAGSEAGGSLMIRTKNRTKVLYGNDSDDFNLIDYEKEAGAEKYTTQPIAGILSYDTYGITSLATTQRFGNFQSALISELIQPYLNDKVGMARASCIVRQKNQYRVFFTNGEAVFVTYSASKLLGMTTISYQHDVACITSLEGAGGREEIYFGSSDGYVRQAEIGTSFDGSPINWSMDLAFNHFGGPRQLKRFRKAVMEVTGSGYSEFAFSSSLAYGSEEFDQTPDITVGTSTDSTNWDRFQWDHFYWDGRSLSPTEADLTGTAENISLLYSGSSDAFTPFTINSVILHFTPQRLLR